MTVLIPALPTPVPQSTDPVNFAARADAFLAALPGFATAANQQADENNQLNASTVAAAASAKEASDLAMASTSASRFDPNATYPAGVVVWSPIDGKTYRRKAAGKAAADPSADAVNWMRQVLTKADFGLGNVDNTSDLNKPISTAVQAALNLKETPAGALEQMRGFGIGTTAGAYPVADLLTHTTAGNFTANASVSAAAGLPLSTLQHSITYFPGVNAATGAIEATALTSNAVSGGRKWFNKRNGGLLMGWREYAFLDSPEFTGLPSTPNMKFGNVASANANTLDFYEEGVFTPGFSAADGGSITTSTAVGSYCRIGNRVMWNCRIQASALIGAGGRLRMTGLPFVVVGNSRSSGAVAIGLISGVSAAIGMVTAMHEAGTANVLFYRRDPAGSNSSNVTAADITETFQAYLQGTYEV